MSKRCCWLTEAFEAAYPRVSHSVDGAAGKAWVYIGILANADEVRWTVDGTDPTTESRLVDGPILIDVPATFKCRGLSMGEHPRSSPSAEWDDVADS